MKIINLKIIIIIIEEPLSTHMSACLEASFFFFLKANTFYLIILIWKETQKEMCEIFLNRDSVC